MRNHYNPWFRKSLQELLATQELGLQNDEHVNALIHAYVRQQYPNLVIKIEDIPLEKRVQYFPPLGSV